ncbi:MAG: response regulator [bacterium]|nr:response regulator [bacterium]
MLEENKVFLLPGEMCYLKKPATISTLLGSCVAVCLIDGKNQWAGMNHYMLPNFKSGNLKGSKCGDTALVLLLKQALKAGSKKSGLTAKIYGGGEVIEHLGSVDAIGMGDIGYRNIALAEKFLSLNEIPIVENITGGFMGRKIHMDTSTSDVKVKEIERSEQVSQMAAKRSRFKQAKPRVLIVDDSSAIRKILRKGIEGSGKFDVCGEAGDPFEARERIMELDPDIICLDIIMPKMNGYKFLKRLMAYKPIPTIAISTIVQEGSAMQQNMLEAGAVATIDKEKLEIHNGFAHLRKIMIPLLEMAALRVVKKIPLKTA